MNWEVLIKAAIDVRKFAYAPYSNYKVGAAVLTEKGKIYTGVNVENSSFGATICAERVAVTKAISNGDNKIIAIAVVGDSNPTYPCGICRQFLTEFGDKDLKIICSNVNGIYKVYDLEELLSFAFCKESLPNE